MSWLFRSRYALVCLLSLPVASAAAADTLERALLRDLDLAFAPIEAVEERPGRRQLMRVDTLPDDRLQLRLPFRPNHLQRLVSDGSRVTAGQAVAEVSGPELANWLLEARLTREQFAAARERYTRNRPLYEQQVLAAELWQRIADRYYALQIDMHHVEHVLEWLHPVADSESRAMLIAPEDGQLLFVELPESADGEIAIVELLRAGALRLTARLPGAQASEVSGLRSGNCDLAVVSREGRVSGLSSRVWSDALNGCLVERPGLAVDGYPVLRFDGYRVPRAAVLRHAGRTLLALDRGGALALQDVTIAGEDARWFYLRSPESLVGQRVLVRSVSAVQGMLLGLGGE